MSNTKSIESRYKKEFLMAMLDSVLMNTDDNVRNKCMEYSFNPEDIPEDVQTALDLVDVVREEYNIQLDMLRDKYEVRLKMALAMLKSAETTTINVGESTYDVLHFNRKNNRVFFCDMEAERAALVNALYGAPAAE